MITFDEYDESFIRVVGDEDDLIKIWEQFSFFPEGFQFAPAFKSGHWDGRIRLVNNLNKTAPKGLLYKLIIFCEDARIEYENHVQHFEENAIDASEYVDKFMFYSKKKAIFPREDQKEAIKRCINMSRCINICPTSFGKSLCIFIDMLYHLEQNRRILLIVPTVSLVEQFNDDIIDYCTDEEGNLTVWFPTIQTIKAGRTKEIDEKTNVVISTWQSIYKEKADFYENFDVIFLDECHKIKGEQLRNIFGRANAVKYKYGYSGSLKNGSMNSLFAEGYIGPIKEITTTSKLMDDGIVANLMVNIIKFGYPEDVREKVSYSDPKKLSGRHGMSYPEEMKFIENYDERTELIIKLAGQFDNTGLILFNHIEHGKKLYNYARKLYPDKTIYYITGSGIIENDKKRDEFIEVKNKIEMDNNSMLICSYGVFSTGISIKNLHYIVFASPTKSFVRTVQSIGRGLRISATKKKVALVDIVDDISFTPKRRKNAIQNYAFKHFLQRYAIYLEQEFKYQTMNINL